MQQGLMSKMADQPPQGEPDDLEPETDPAYAQARELMLSKLYEEGAAEGIGQALSQAPSVAQGITDQSMALLDVMEQATQGSVPDELVMSFVMDVVQEVVDIAGASGLQVASRDVAEATREVLAQVVETMGADATAIRAEMAQISPDEVGAQIDQMEG
jgi:hypothetical protein